MTVSSKICRRLQSHPSKPVTSQHPALQFGSSGNFFLCPKRSSSHTLQNVISHAALQDHQGGMHTFRANVCGLVLFVTYTPGIPVSTVDAHVPLLQGRLNSSGGVQQVHQCADVTKPPSHLHSVGTPLTESPGRWASLGHDLADESGQLWITHILSSLIASIGCLLWCLRCSSWRFLSL